jgi:hypothetical protein
MIKTTCPHCFQQYEVEDSALGIYADCQSCGKRFRVQVAQPAGIAAGGCERSGGRLSMTVALVFQCIMVGGSLLATIEETLALLFFVPAILALVFSAILHHDCWKAIPAGFARMTPGKAVGYLFIPFFGLYWFFPSVGGLGSDCAALAKAKGFRGYENLGGLGLALATLMCVESVLGCVPVLGLLISIAEFVLWLLFYRSVTKLLNGLSVAMPAAPSAE